MNKFWLQNPDFTLIDQQGGSCRTHDHNPKTQEALTVHLNSRQTEFDALLSIQQSRGTESEQKDDPLENKLKKMIISNILQGTLQRDRIKDISDQHTTDQTEDRTYIHR